MDVEKVTDEIELLSQDLRSQSLSEREIVLPYQQALEALEILMKAKFALLGWEGWVKYADGHHGHTSSGVMGTESIDRKAGETWVDYVQRSVLFCTETMAEAQRNWNANPDTTHLSLYFCLTATSKEAYEK